MYWCNQTSIAAAASTSHAKIAHHTWSNLIENTQEDVIKRKHFPRYWTFVRGIHRSPVDSPHKGQWRGTLMFSFIYAWTNGWVNNRDAGDLRHHRAHYDVTVMSFITFGAHRIFADQPTSSHRLLVTLRQAIDRLSKTNIFRPDCDCHYGSYRWVSSRQT